MTEKCRQCTIADLQGLLREVEQALLADPVTKLAWDRLTCHHHSVLLVGHGLPADLPEGMVRIEVGLADLTWHLFEGAGETCERSYEDGEAHCNLHRAHQIHHAPDASRSTAVTFDYPEANFDDIPQRVTEGVRAHIEKEPTS